MMSETKLKTSLTLVEAVVVVSIFAVIAAAAGSALFTTARSGAKLADKAGILLDANWAIDFIVNEARWGIDFEDDPFIPGGDIEAVYFSYDVNGDGNNDRVWYWRGFKRGSEVFGSDDVVYRGVDMYPIESGPGPQDKRSLDEADLTRQELIRFIVDNPVDSATADPFAIFEYDPTNRRLGVILTVEYPGPSGDQIQTFRAEVTALNNIP